MTTITDEFMHEMMAKTKPYTILILRGTEKLAEPGAKEIIWEHGRRNFQLRAEGKLAIVCPVREGLINGVGIFTTGLAETRDIIEGDPAVQAGLFTYELLPTRSFPGDAL